MRIRIPILLIMTVTTISAQSLAPRPEQPSWIGSWAASIFEGDSGDGVPTLVDSTLREVVHTSVTGSQLRVRLSNEFGIEPLRIGVASIATSAGGSSINPATIHDLTFGGSPSIVIPPGAEVLSDPVPMATLAFENLAVSLYLPLQQISDVSVHSSAQQDNYIQTGNHVQAVSLTAPVVVPSWYFVKGVDVETVAARHATVVAFGDSITDGAGSTDNANHRWPDYLALRLHNNPTTSSISVVNEGISGNCVLKRCAGPNALARFDRDVLSQAGVKYVIVLEGINDIGTLHNPNRPNDSVTAEDLEQGLSQLVARAHERGIRIFGGTLTPYKGADYFTERGEEIRETVNRWILTSGGFDGAIDFDKATRDPANLLMLAPQYDSGDHLHPQDAGYAAMADSIDLRLFD